MQTAHRHQREKIGAIVKFHYDPNFYGVCRAVQRSLPNTPQARSSCWTSWVAFSYSVASNSQALPGLGFRTYP